MLDIDIVGELGRPCSLS